MSLIIDKNCVYKTVDQERKTDNKSIPKKYLKLTCPLALFANNSSPEENIPFISSDELSQHFDKFFPGNNSIIDKKLLINKKQSNEIKSNKKTFKYYKTPGGKKTTNKTRKK